MHFKKRTGCFPNIKFDQFQSNSRNFQGEISGFQGFVLSYFLGDLAIVMKTKENRFEPIKNQFHSLASDHEQKQCRSPRNSSNFPD